MNRRTLLGWTLALSVFTATFITLNVEQVQANYFGNRQYYSGFSYHSSHNYYYSSYYYKPYDSYSGYKTHYCIYYPSTPRYVYYYNTYSQQYWGRYDLEEKGYSLLAEKDRSGDLKKIPETAFPKPGKMPTIPEAEDNNTAMLEISPESLPKAEAPKDAPK
jgi:hypothetical protein